MKKYIISLLTAVFALTSCTDVLDVTPDGRIDLDQVFSDPELTAAYLSTCYNNIPKKSRRYFWFQNYPIALSDEAYSCDDVEGIGPVLAYKGQVSAGYNPMEANINFQFDHAYWETYYQQIRTINMFLSHIPTAAVNDESDRNRFTGEAHVLRAFFYLQLVKWYGDVPIIKDVLPTDYDYSQMRRNPAKEVLKFIVEDCEEGLKSNIPWRLTSDTEVWRMTKAIAMAIRSQASLYAASELYNGGENLWDWAYAINKDCFDQLKANGYALYTVQQDKEHYSSAYQEYFVQNGEFSANPTDRETIWQSPFAEEAMWYVAGTPAQNCYMAGDVPSQQLVDAYDMLSTGKPVLDLAKPYNDETMLEPNYAPNSGYNAKRPYEGRDPRFYATVIYNGAKVVVNDKEVSIQTTKGGNSELNATDRRNTRTGYYVRKGAYYNTTQSSGQSSSRDGRWKYYRLGEIYLNLAEAAIESGKHIDEGIALINEIRHRAGFAPAVDVKAANQQEARLLLRHERQVELAYEEHRYFDVRRWTRADQNLDNEKYCIGMRVEKKGFSMAYTRFIVGSDGSYPSKMNYEAKWHFFPVPLDEASRMESLTGVNWQNPGW